MGPRARGFANGARAATTPVSSPLRAGPSSSRQFVCLLRHRSKHIPPWSAAANEAQPRPLVFPSISRSLWFSSFRLERNWLSAQELSPRPRRVNPRRRRAARPTNHRPTASLPPAPFVWVPTPVARSRETGPAGPFAVGRSRRRRARRPFARPNAYLRRPLRARSRPPLPKPALRAGREGCCPHHSGHLPPLNDPAKASRADAGEARAKARAKASAPRSRSGHPDHWHMPFMQV